MLHLQKTHWDLALARTPAPAAEPAVLRDLERVGLLSEPASATDRQRLLRFAAGRGIAVDLLSICGVHLAMAHLDAPSGTTTASGKGFSPLQAISGCLAEAAEFESWLFRETDRQSLLGADDISGMMRLDAKCVLGFSEPQIASRDRLNCVWQGWDCIPPRQAQEQPELWSAVSGFDGGRAACPAFLAYGHFGDLAGDPTLNVDSNGCAAGETLDAARSSAVLELVERDATGIWWNGGCVCPRLELAAIADAELTAAISAHREETGRRIWFLDISTFRNASVLVAISCEPSGEDLALGFGAAFEASAAAKAAYLELVQSEVSLAACDLRLSEGRPHSDDRRLIKWRRFADIRDVRFAIGTPAAPTPARAASLPALLAEIALIGSDVWFMELTRPDIEIPVVKALCEGLVHYKLRRGSRRFNLVPQALGWTATRAGTGRSGPRKLLI